MYLPKSDGGNFELTPDGTFIARCYRFIDLGSHEQTFQGESKGKKRLIMIGFELPTEFMSDGRPFSIHKRYTWSMHEKAALRRDLEAWRGAKFAESDFGPGGFNARNLLGKACTLSIVHTSGADSTYANIAGIGKPMKGVQVPEPVNPPVYFTLENDGFDQAVFDSLSDKLKEFIRGTPEYRALQGDRRGYAEQSGKGRDPARDDRYESGDDFDSPPPPSSIDDYGFPGDYPVDRGGNPTHPAMAG